jgi:hypothetical protein
MIRVAARALLLLLAVTVTPRVSTAQGEGIGLGYTDIGPVVGLGGIGGASLAIGGRFERVFKALPDLGDGLLGIQVGVDWWSWDYGFIGGSSSISYIPIGVTANYHFKMENKKIDPFLGAGLGYQIVSASCVYQGIDYCSGTYGSALYFIAKAGIRYWISQALALYADAGAGAATLNAGVMFRMKQGEAAASRR